jgi:hypothetical protein
MFQEKVAAAGGLALVINEENVMDLTKLILDTKQN